MKLISVAAIAALVAVVAGHATAATATTPPLAPTRQPDYRRLLPFWNPRSRRRELLPHTAPTPTEPARKRDDPSSALDFSVPPAPTQNDKFEIEDPFPADILETTFTGTVFSESATVPIADASGTGTSTGASAMGTSDSSPASDSVWEDATNHGCRLVDAMRDPESEAGQLYNPPRTSLQSSLMSYENDFQGWGWNANEISGNNFTAIDGGQNQGDPGWGIGNALRALSLSDKISSQGGQIHIIDAIHGKEPFTQGYTKDGKTYPQTGAEFKIGIDTAHGVLMAIDRISPASAAKKRSPPVSNDQLPAISTFADTGYLNYKHILGQDPSDFKYMLSVAITNEKTKSIIAKALQNKGKSLGPWPGQTFKWNEKEFKALLGSPNGMGFGYLLVQHKKQLSSMFVDQVRVFSGDTWHQLPNMVFRLKTFDGITPPDRTSGQPPTMEETAAPSNGKRGGLAFAEPKIHVRDVKNFVRTHIVHTRIMHFEL